MVVALLLSGLLFAQTPPGSGLKPPLQGGQAPAGQVPAGQIPAGQVPGGQMPGGAGGQMPGGQVPGGPTGAGGIGMGGAGPMGGAMGAPGGKAGEGGSATVADVRRLIVRGKIEGAKTVEVTVTAAGAPAVSAKLDDAGNAPDPVAGDGEFTADLLLPGDTVTVSVSVDGTAYDAGSVSWAATDERRLLELTKADGAVTAKASVGEKRGGPGSEGAKGGGAGVAPLADGQRKPPMGGAGAPGAEGGSGWAAMAFPLAILVGLVALGAIIGLLPRRRLAKEPVFAGLARIPPSGLLGSGTPSLESGLRVWGMPPADRPLVLASLMETIARYNPIVVVAEDGESLPAPLGGAVYRGSGEPRAILESARDLASPGRPTVILVVPPVGQPPATWPESTPNCRVIQLISPPPDAAAVIVGREPGGWRLRTATDDRRLPDLP